MKRKFFFIAMLITMAFFWYSCSDFQKSNPVEPTQTIITNNPSSNQPTFAQKAVADEGQMLAEFAKKLAKHAANDAIRSIIVSEIARSENGEKIIYLEKLFAVDIGPASFAETVGANTALLQLVNEHALGIDVYFPVKAHRQSMLANPNQDFLVTYFDGYADDQVERDIAAWDLNGAQVTLTTKEPPAIPVLVITQCEHGRRAAGEGGTEQITLPPDDGGGSGGSGNGGPQNGLQMTAFDLHDKHEPWTSGSPEIYIRARHKANSSWSSWERKDLENVNSETLYLFNPPVKIHSSWDWTSQPLDLEVWEDDPWSDDRLETNGWRKGQANGQFNDWFWISTTPLWNFGTNRDADIEARYGS